MISQLLFQPFEPAYLRPMSRVPRRSAQWTVENTGITLLLRSICFDFAATPAFRLQSAVLCADLLRPATQQSLFVTPTGLLGTRVL